MRKAPRQDAPTTPERPGSGGGAMPRWVMALIGFGIVVVLAFLGLHLFGGGMAHMNMGGH